MFVYVCKVRCTLAYKTTPADKHKGKIIINFSFSFCVRTKAFHVFLLSIFCVYSEQEDKSIKDERVSNSEDICNIADGEKYGVGNFYDCNKKKRKIQPECVAVYIRIKRETLLSKIIIIKMRELYGR